MLSRGFGLAGMMPDGMPPTSIGQPAVSYSGVAGIGGNAAGSMSHTTEFVIQDQDFPALPGAKREKCKMR